MAKDKADDEDKGVFWMAWADFLSYFGELTICRLLPERVEARQGGWLSSIFNAGNALALEVFAHTHLELTVHQEAHITRGETSFATLLDLGLVVLKEGRGPERSWSLVAESERTLKPSGQLEATLEQDDVTQHRQSARLRSAPARPLCLPGARLAAQGSVVLSERGPSH